MRVWAGDGTCDGGGISGDGDPLHDFLELPGDDASSVEPVSMPSLS